MEWTVRYLFFSIYSSPFIWRGSLLSNVQNIHSGKATRAQLILWRAANKTSLQTSLSRNWDYTRGRVRTHARTNRLRNNNNRTTPQYRNVSPWSQVRTLIIKKRNSSAGNHKVTNWSMLRRTLKNIYWNFQPITISCKQWKNPLCSVEIVQMENVLVTHGGVASGETGWGGEKMSLISPPSPPLWFSVG